MFSRIGAEVPEVTWLEPGEDAALEALMGKARGFVNTYLSTLTCIYQQSLPQHAFVVPVGLDQISEPFFN